MRIKQQQHIVNNPIDNDDNVSETYHQSTNKGDATGDGGNAAQVYNMETNQVPTVTQSADAAVAQPSFYGDDVLSSQQRYRRQVGLLHKLRNICRNIIREPIIIVALIIITFLIMFVRPFLVPSGSMVPTLQEGDRILSIAQYFQDGDTYEVGDIVCFYASDGTVYVKRVIATGGDLVEISGEKVYVNGELSPYQGTGGQVTSLKVQLADDEYFVMGDNRGNSEDSRFIGPIKASQMISKVICIYYPFEHFTIF